MSNGNLHRARVAKNDEFYTLYKDVFDELNHYAETFNGKRILCNCDDPNKSAFWKYFHVNFSALGIIEVISTHYVSGGKSYMISYRGGCDKDITYGDVTPINGDGDFRSIECSDILNHADIVVTNPPFSLFREYVAQLVSYGKKFIIIGNKTAITYREIFLLIKNNKMWVGNRPIGRELLFTVPEEYEGVLLDSGKVGSSYRVIDGKVYARSSAIWFTNVDIPKRHVLLPLHRQYIESDYPRYDNYDAINVDRVKDIPFDYDGVMGVPITFIDKYNPDQFEIVDMSPYFFELDSDCKKPKQLSLYNSGRSDPYARILIRRIVRSDAQ